MKCIVIFYTQLTGPSVNHGLIHQATQAANQKPVANTVFEQRFDSPFSLFCMNSTHDHSI